MSTLHCFVLMPFGGHRSFVYHYAIQEAVRLLSEELVKEHGPSIDLQVHRADDLNAPTTDKLAQIQKVIQKSDVVITDISEWNPNVMWELGYSTAMHKILIVLCDDRDDRLPFNVSTSDILKYNFSYDGLCTLKTKLIERLRSVIPLVEAQKGSLITHEEFGAARRQVISTLKKISRDSLLKRLALNELNRIGARFAKLGKGSFVLRNEKPYEEIIRYYCAYVSQLRGENCSFDVVSNLSFWDEITERGSDFQYLDANLDAVRNGAYVRRVILVDSQRFPTHNLSANAVYRTILRKFYEAAQTADSVLETRLLFTENYAADRKSLSNFGILQKASELLLFKPLYDEENRMIETRFLYINRDNSKIATPDSHESEVEQHEAKFNAAWARP